MLYRWRWPLGVLPAGLALVFCLLPGSAISHPLTIVVGSVLGNPPALPDPLPIRRTLLPAERADTVLATAGRDLFLRLPRSEFEAQVQQAARRQAADRTPPQIVEATYQARWSPGCLIGRGQWRIKNPGSLPGTVILEPLTPAIDNPTWGDGSPASIFRGIPPGRVGINTCLWNASESGGDLNFDWSLRGLDEAEEVRFDLGFPTAPITSFELTLPADRTPMVPAGQGFIQGPFAGKQPREQIWKIGPGIAGRIELAIRQPSTIRNTTPAIFSRSARWLLSANARNGTIETTIDAPRRTPTERKFQLDADLMVHDVVGAGVESWKLQGNELFVRSQDHSGPMKWLFTVSSTAQAGPAGWACPILRLADALPGTDTVEIQCAPDVKIEQWLPGDFRVAATAANHATKVLFTGTLLPPNGDDRPDRKMPTLRYKTAEYEFTTREKMEWQIEPGKNSLVSAIEVRVIRGPLANLGLQLLPGYTPTNITAIPDDPGLTWIAAPGVPNTWIIEPTRAVSGGSTFGLRIEARGSAFPQPGHTEDQTPVPTILPFPKVRPLGASDRHLTMVASTGAGLEARFQSSTPGAEVRDGVFHAEYVQRDGEGDAVVSAILPIVRVGQSVVLKAIDDQGINVLSTFRCKVERSLAAGMMIAVPGTGEPNFSWNGVAAKGKRASLPGIGDRMLLPFVLPPGGHLLGSLLEQHSETTLWFVTFARPSMGENTLTVEYPVKVRQDAKPLDVPLAKVCGGHIDETRVSLDSLLADRFQPPLAPSSNSVVLLPRNGVPASPEPVRRTGWVLSHLQWSNRVDHTGQIHSTLSGHVVEAGGPFLEIQQAGGFGTLESARVGSHEVPLPLGRRTDLIRLPIVSAGESFELRYRVPQAAGQRPAFPLRTTEPQLPGVERLETIWQSEGDFLFWPRLGTHASGESSFPQWVLRASVLRATGYSLAFLALTMGWWIWLSPQNRRVELLVFVAILALGLASRIDSPGWSLLLRPMLLVGIVVYAGSVLRRGMAIPRWPASATALVLIAVAQAQAPEPSVVYLVPGTDGGDSIYAPKSLIAKLEAMAKPALPPAVLIRAEYELRHDDDFATVDAVFQIESHGSREQTFDLPLTGIRLERASINGRPAFLDGSKVDRFTIVLQNAGQHILELRFTVPVDSTGSDREVRIGTPDVPCCRVSLATGSRTRQLDVPTRRGGQSLASRESGLQLTADHGGGKTIHVRWRDDSTTDGAKPTLSVREASLWDLGEAECTCTSVFQYRIQNGTLSQLKFECPENLVPVRVDVRTLEPRTQPLGVKSWSLGNAVAGWCPVDVKLQSPVDGRISMIVKLRPKKLLTMKPTLRVPRSAEPFEGEREATFGFRLNGLQLDNLTTTASAEIPADSLNKDFTGISELNLEKPPVRLYRRTGTNIPEGKLTLSVPSLVKAEALEIAYTLGRRAEAEGRCLASIREGGVLEFDIPAGFRMFDVDGPKLGGWWRVGNRVAVWFDSGAPASVEVTFRGAMNSDLVAASAEGGIDLPLPRWLNLRMAGHPMQLEVRNGVGYQAKLVNAIGMQVNDELPPAPGRWNFLAVPGSNAVPSVKFFILRMDDKPNRFDDTEPSSKPIATKEVNKTPLVPPTAEPPAEPRQRPFAHLIPWIGAGAWLIGLMLVARWPVRRWPERLAFLGLLGAAALGFLSLSGMAMLALAAFGVAARVRKFLT